jgi:hypothetical protein
MFTWKKAINRFDWNGFWTTYCDQRGRSSGITIREKASHLAMPLPMRAGIGGNPEQSEARNYQKLRMS